VLNVEKTMDNPNKTEAIFEARKRFLIAHEREREAMKAADEIRLDIRLAEREGQPTEALKERKAEHNSKVWHPAYCEWRDAAKALCEALDIEPQALKSAL